MAEIEKNDVVQNTPGQIVLQWLTYAFWAWTSIAIAYVASAITTHIVGGTWASDAIEPIAYGAAAAFVLLPIAVVCDWLYSKHEPLHKRGIASVIMIIHAVLFALVAIGALITAAFSVVSLLLANGDTTGSTVSLVVSLVLAALYTDLTVRTLRPALFKRFRLWYRIGMAVVTVAALVWVALGPIQQSVVTKDDRAVRDGIGTLNVVINQYASTEFALPASLDQVVTESSLVNSYPQSSVQAMNSLLDRGLITYKPNTKPSSKTPNQVNIEVVIGESTTYYYELCGTFSHGLKQRSWYSPAYPEIAVDSDGYGLNINEGVIDAGTHCYKLSTVSYKE